MDPIEIKLAGIHAAEAANGIVAVARTLVSIVEHLEPEDPMATLLDKRATMLYEVAKGIEENVLKPLRREVRRLKT